MPRFSLFRFGFSFSALSGRLSVVVDLGAWRLWLYREPRILVASLGPVHIGYAGRKS